MNLSGKVIDFLGDSITEGHGVSDKENYRYDNIIKNQCNLKAVYNYGIGGTRFAHQINPSIKPRHDLCFCGRAYDLNPEADIIIVYGGTNDFGGGDAPFGNITDTTPSTFCGAVDFLMKLLLELYPMSKIVFVTPARRNQDNEVRTHWRKDNDGRVLSEYVEVIKLKGKELDIPVLDLFHTLDINPNKESDREMYAPDGLHFNDEGHKHIAECLIDFLRKL